MTAPPTIYWVEAQRILIEDAASVFVVDPPGIFAHGDDISRHRAQPALSEHDILVPAAAGDVGLVRQCRHVRCNPTPPPNPLPEASERRELQIMRTRSPGRTIATLKEACAGYRAHFGATDGDTPVKSCRGDSVSRPQFTMFATEAIAMTELVTISAVEATRRFPRESRFRRWSSCEALISTLRGGQSEWSTPLRVRYFRTRALEAARAAEARYARMGEPCGGLDGVALAVKDSTAGQRRNLDHGLAAVRRSYRREADRSRH